ncbi:Hpt domain-containing protein [Cognatishimia sp. MH4019]|uniref:Hpt domain-containing protein n=1 Tax=Cognatishimia sp. MH4019 TaxID=2854030 RepID=UPI001CD3F707|nr:Hpt domain-containing protein [Cognatishimia sp. MH4019]
MIDWTRIEDLKMELGDEDFEEVFRIFLDEVQDSVDSLETAPTNQTLEAILHSVKGNAVTVGFSKLAELAGAGEISAGQGADVNLQEIISAHRLSKDAYLAGRT